MGLKIIGTGGALPHKVVTNDDLSAFLDTSSEWIVSKSGIKTRRVCTDESLTDLAEAASRAALTKAGLKVADLDLIICATTSGDYVLPSLACCISQRLAAWCPAFDVSAACTGFIYALDVAQAYLEAGKAKHILVVGADMMSKYVDWNDRSTCVLFGDGAGAVVTTNGSALRYIKLMADGNAEPLSIRAGRGNSPFARSIAAEGDDRPFVHMRGQEVFKFAVQAVEKESRLAMETLRITPDEVDFFVLHQANRRIIESIRTRLKQPEEKFPVNIDRYGNTSAASIPILLDELLAEKRIKTGDTVLFSAFGAGMTTGTCVMTWE